MKSAFLPAIGRVDRGDGRRIGVVEDVQLAARPAATARSAPSTSGQSELPPMPSRTASVKPAPRDLGGEGLQLADLTLGLHERGARSQPSRVLIDFSCAGSFEKSVGSPSQIRFERLLACAGARSPRRSPAAAPRAARPSAVPTPTRGARRAARSMASVSAVIERGERLHAVGEQAVADARRDRSPARRARRRPAWRRLEIGRRARARRIAVVDEGVERGGRNGVDGVARP